MEANGLAGRVTVQRLDWRQWRGRPALGLFDLVLGADLLYASVIVKV